MSTKDQTRNTIDVSKIRPLVPTGQSRRKILKSIIEEWAKQLESEDEFSTPNTLEPYKIPSAVCDVDFQNQGSDAPPVSVVSELLIPLARQLEQRQQGNDSGKPRLFQIHVAFVNCRIAGLIGNGITFPFHLSFLRCEIDEGRLSHSKFLGEVCLNDTIAHRGMILSNATFHSEVSVLAIRCGLFMASDASFKRSAVFTGARVQILDLNRTTFAHECLFIAIESNVTKMSDARFEGTINFREASFGRESSFARTHFSGLAIFYESIISGAIDFTEASFYDGAIFDHVLVEGNAYYDRASLYGYVSFASAKFAKNVVFSGATFSGRLHLEMLQTLGGINATKADMRTAEITRAPVPITTLPIADSISLKATDWVNWGWVRAIGELSVLTRVSFLALVLVPILAGIWTPLRLWLLNKTNASSELLETFVERLPPQLNDSDVEAEILQFTLEFKNSTIPEYMPTSWLLAFLTAFLLVLAQLVYQIFSPELIRIKSEEELVDDANELNRKEGRITDERLRQAIDHLHTAADSMPHRHNAWFVKRQRRLVWIPDDIAHHYVDKKTDVPMAIASREETESFDLDVIHLQWTKSESLVNYVQQVDGEDRKRIAIEEGQRALYAMASFEKRTAAWVSGGMYILSGWLSLMIVLRQMGNVAEVSRAKAYARIPIALSSESVTFWGAFSIIFVFGIGTALVFYRSRN